MNRFSSRNIPCVHFVLFSILFITVLAWISAVGVRAQDTANEVPQSGEKLIVFRAFSSSDSSTYLFSKNELEDFRSMLTLYISEPYRMNPQLQTVVVGIGNDEEDDIFEKRVFTDRSTAIPMQNFVNFEQVEQIAAENGARLALLLNIRTMSRHHRTKREYHWGEKVEVSYYGYSFELTFLLYDVVNKKILHDEMLVASDDIEDCDDDFYYLSPKISRISRTDNGVIVDDDNLFRVMNTILDLNMMKNFRYLITVLHSKASPLINDMLIAPIVAAEPPAASEAGGASGAAMPGGNAMLVMSALTGNDDVRAYAFVPERKAFDPTAVGGMFDGFPNYPDDGVYVAAGDFDGDGKDELVLSAGYDYQDRTQKKGGFTDTQIRIYKWEGDKFDRDAPMAVLDNLFPEKKTGAYVAAGDFDGDGDDELVVSQCNWYDHVKIIDYSDGAFVTDEPLGEIEKLFFQKKGHETGGYIAAGDFDGDGIDEIVISKAAGDEQIKVLKLIDGTLSVLTELENLYFEYDQGVSVAAGDFNGDKIDELVFSSVNGNDDVRILSFRNGAIDTRKPFANLFDLYKNYNNGVSVAAGDFDGCGADEIVLVPNAAEDDVRIFKYTQGRFETFSGLYDMYSGYAGGMDIAVGNF